MSSLSVPGVTDDQLDAISKEVARMQLHGCLSPAAINVDVLAGLIERIRTERARTDHLLTAYNKAADRMRNCEKDAARYRWIKWCVPEEIDLVIENPGDGLDQAIDTAMEQQP